jgi:hypothetical protein
LLHILASRRFHFHKRSQLFIGAHNEPLSVIAVRISNEDNLTAGINRGDTAPTPTGFAEILGDYLPLLHRYLVIHV